MTTSTRHTTTATLAALTLALGALAFAPTVVADERPTLTFDDVPQMATDAAGDANGLNGQGVADGSVPSTSTAPAQLENADILGARITSVFEEVTGEDGLVDRVLTGLEFRTELPAAPTATDVPVIHRFIGQTGSCVFWVQSYLGTNGANPHGTANLRLFDAGCGLADSGDPLGVNETVSGDWIGWTFDEATSEMVVTLDLAATSADGRFVPKVKRDALYLLDRLEVRVNTGVVTAPIVDEMAGQNGFTRIGSDIPADEAPPVEEGDEVEDSSGTP